MNNINDKIRKEKNNNFENIFNKDIKIDTNNEKIDAIIHVIESAKLDKNTIVTLLLGIITMFVPLIPSDLGIDSIAKLYFTYIVTILAILLLSAIGIYNKLHLKKRNNLSEINNVNTNAKKSNNRFKNIFSKIHFEFIDIVIILYSVLILLSTIFSEYFPDILLTPANGRGEGTFTLYLYLILFYIAYKLIDFKEAFFKCLATSSMVISFIAIGTCLVKIIGGFSGKLITAYFGNSNFFSSYICLVLPIYIVMYLKKGEGIYLTASFLSFASLLLTDCLGGQITFCIYFTLIIIENILNKGNKKRLFAIILSFVITLIAVNIITGGTTIRIFNKINTEAQKIETNNLDALGTGRGFIFKLSFKMIKESPWLGVGPDGLGNEIYKYYYFTPEYTSKYFFDKAHSEYLQIAVCTGLPSLICYITLVATIGITMFIKFLKNKNNNSLFAVGIGLFGYLFQASANISVVQVAPIFWIMLGIGYNLAKNTDKKNIIFE